MKRIKLSFALVAALLILASATAELTLDQQGLWQPSEFYSQQGGNGSRALVNDGSFELGPPPDSAWDETSTPSCEWIGIFSGSWYVSAYDGTYDYWAGGYCLDEDSGLNIPASSSVSQVFSIPAGGGELSFYYIAFRPDSDDVPQDVDHAYVAVNGTEIWSLEFLRSNNTYPFWDGPVLLDLAAYAGQDITLSFGAVAEGTITGNVRFDYIELNDPTATSESNWSLVKTQY